ncbi:hypothetical protein Tsubulata_014564, partial [Turnera subulata]
GQASLPANRRLTCRKDSALEDYEIGVFSFADTYRGSYNVSLGPWVFPFYCDYSGYEGRQAGSFAEFGWDTKNAGINIFVSRVRLFQAQTSFCALSYLSHQLYLSRSLQSKRVIHCGNVVATSSRLVPLAKGQVQIMYYWNDISANRCKL